MVRDVARQAAVSCAAGRKSSQRRDELGSAAHGSRTNPARRAPPAALDADCAVARAAVWTADTAGDKAYTHDWEGLSTDAVADIRFADRDQPGVNQLYTYPVGCGIFDNLLLQHAHKRGATVCEGIRVKGIDLDDPSGIKIRYTLIFPSIIA